MVFGLGFPAFLGGMSSFHTRQNETDLVFIMFPFPPIDVI